MSILNSISKAEEFVTRDSAYRQEKEIYVYQIKLSNSSQVLQQCLEFVKRDSHRQKEYIILFNAKYLKLSKDTLDNLNLVFSNYKQLLFSKKLYKFAIRIKSFYTHRKLVGLFDKLFDESKVSRKKYNYFSRETPEQVLDWLTK